MSKLSTEKLLANIIMNFNDNLEYLSEPTTSTNSFPNNYEGVTHTEKLGDQSQIELKCGKCNSLFGLSTIVLPELIHIRRNNCMDGATRYSYQCLVCRWMNRLKDAVEEHILYHIIQKELLCLNCQVGLSSKVQSSDVMFNTDSTQPEVQLQTFHGSPTQIRPSVPAAVPVTTGRLSASCSQCGKEFGPVNDVVAALINLTKESNPTSKYAYTYICALCNFTTLKKDVMEDHVLCHFSSCKVFCKLCQKEKILRMKLLKYNLQE